MSILALCLWQENLGGHEKPAECLATLLNIYAEHPSSDWRCRLTTRKTGVLSDGLNRK